LHDEGAAGIRRAVGRRHGKTGEFRVGD
jgi:hypothetical protein